jgi:hypothetical protein
MASPDPWLGYIAFTVRSPPAGILRRPSDGGRTRPTPLALLGWVVAVVENGKEVLSFEDATHPRSRTGTHHHGSRGRDEDRGKEAPL